MCVQKPSDENGAGSEFATPENTQGLFTQPPLTYDEANVHIAMIGIATALLSRHAEEAFALGLVIRNIARVRPGVIRSLLKKQQEVLKDVPMPGKWYEQPVPEQQGA